MILSNNQQPRFSRSGFTLIEMLVAMTLSLVLFFAVAQMFSQLGNIMDDGRALIEMSGELRGVTHTLQQDLDNRTVEVQPWIQPGTNQGYFEIVEGPDRDKDFVDPAVNSTIDRGAGEEVDMGGDADDILAFTAYSKDEPFVGLIQGVLKTFDPPNNKYKYWIDRSATNPPVFTAITSEYAEIVYWTRCTDNDDRQVLLDNTEADAFTNGKRDWDETVTLYRRVLLIRPDIAFGVPDSGSVNLHNMKYRDFRNYYDLSARITTNSGIREWDTNSLEDLQTRKNRFSHYYIEEPPIPDPPAAPTPPAITKYPATENAQSRYPIVVKGLQTFEDMNRDNESDKRNSAPGTINILRDRTGEDVVLSKALAFDVRVFDPHAPIDNSNSVAIQPGDLGFNLDTGTFSGEGAYVDLGWNTFSAPSNNSIFSGAPHPNSLLDNHTMGIFTGNPTVRPIAGAKYYAYDTWPFLYEMDGIDSDNKLRTDQGTNGFDDNNNNIIDDAGELETSPPYPEPLRGIQVQIRVYEDGSRQIRQDTVMGDFIPE